MPEKRPDGTYEAQIDGIEYRFQQWGAQRALEVGMQLAAVLSGPVEALGQAVSSAEDRETDVRIGPLIGALFASMGTHRKDAMDVIKTLSTVGIEYIDAENGGRICKVGNFDQVFRGKLTHLQKVVTAAAEVQFGDFFGEIAGALATAKPRKSRKPAQTDAQSSPP